MGENNCWEREVLITELTKGKELMLQLQKHFDPMKQDAEILSSYDKAMSLLNGTALSGMMMSKGKEIIHPAPSSSTASQLESPHLLADSSAPLNPGRDGLSWRKYGRKLVLGEKYPRKYYRCARRCCGATKMIRRIDTEPLTFEVTYGGSHNCDQENNNQNEQPLLAVQTQVGRTAGELSDFYFREMVSTPNNSSSTGVVFSNSNSVFNMSNSDFIPTPTSSPHPFDNISLTDVLFVHDVPENTRSTYQSSANDFNSPNHILKKLSFDHYLI
ncbi:hypothetical protein KY284_024223 [Solanum tuberosum]|nr:hypothetical protein KY284_024223 [Solanum tuberosum]